nr:MAG TPA: hypothetical protein [Caudoviricetes sp.]
MTIRDFYRACLSMQPKTSIRVYDKDQCIYNGEYGDLPCVLAKHEFVTLVVNPQMEWKFYF